jgi:hypothetical protein
MLIFDSNVGVIRDAGADGVIWWGYRPFADRSAATWKGVN